MTAVLRAEGTTPVTGIDWVLFVAGGLTFAVASAQVRAMAVAEDRQAPELAALLGLPAAAPITGAQARQRRLLWLLHPTGDQAVQVCEPVVHYHLAATALYPLPPLLAARLTLPCVRALAGLSSPAGESLVIVLDSTRLPVPGYADLIR